MARRWDFIIEVLRDYVRQWPERGTALPEAAVNFIWLSMHKFRPRSPSAERAGACGTSAFLKLGIEFSDRSAKPF